MSSLSSSLEALLESEGAKALLPSSKANLIEFLTGSSNPVDHQAVLELAEQGAWEELNDRFFRKLAFGTGGLRGRTIGRVVAPAERAGRPSENAERPEYPAVGTNTMNYFNARRATMGLVAYLHKTFGTDPKPSLVISHDTRHFSREFAEDCARVAAENGVDVYLFDGPRATPEMSFAVRQLNASAGVQLTASHNPAHDNGYKVNFVDGAQIVEPHASHIIQEVNALNSDAYTPLPVDQQGKVTALGASFDDCYLDRLESLLLQPDLLKKAQDLKIVFTALHGTGGVLVPALLKRLGFEFLTVPEQDVFDGRFPTVASPNPENGPALKMAMDLADKTAADLVIGTDPDADRMGVAVRDQHGKLVLITGNQIGSLMAWYRVKTFFEMGILNDTNRNRAILIKTFVTSDLQRAIGIKAGIQVMDTLTGFKYISAKLGKYEKALPEAAQANYRNLSEAETRQLRLEHSKFFVFGGEESYGYLGTDFVRDKDANGAVVMFAEVAAYAKSQGLTLIELLDQIYQEYGYYLEINHSKTFEGASGAAQIAKLAESYVSNPPQTIDDSPVKSLRDFLNGTHLDEEGEEIPKEKMFIFELEDGRRFAVRPSGTEPKIKYYLFGQGKPNPENLEEDKKRVRTSLDHLWTWLELDIQSRLSA